MDAIDTFYEAIGSVWGRALCCGFAIMSPYLFLGFDFGGVALFPLAVATSVAGGWGILVYAFLLGFYGWFVASETSFWYLPVAACVSGVDLWRVVVLWETWSRNQ